MKFQMLFNANNAHTSVLILALIQLYVNLALLTLKEKEIIVFVKMDSGIKLLILIAILVENYVPHVAMEQLVTHVLKDLIEKETYVIAKMDSMMMELTSANHVQFIV